MEKPMRSVGRPGKEKLVKHPDFMGRFQALAHKRGMVRKDFVKPHTEMNDATLGNYWRGERLPIHKYAKAIADRLDVTVDYLLYGSKDGEPKILEPPAKSKQDEADTILEVPAKSKLNREEIYILKTIMEKITGRPCQENFIIVSFS